MPYRDLLEDVEATVLKLLRRFKYQEDEAPLTVASSQRTDEVQGLEGEGVVSVDSTVNGKVSDSDEDINKEEEEKAEKDNYVIIDRIQESRVQGPPSGCRLDRLTALLKAEKLQEGEEKQSEEQLVPLLGSRHLLIRAGRYQFNKFLIAMYNILFVRTIPAGAYVSNHYHSVEDCCCMTEDKVRAFYPNELLLSRSY